MAPRRCGGGSGASFDVGRHHVARLIRELGLSYKAECAQRLGPWRDASELEIATGRMGRVLQQAATPRLARAQDAARVRGRLLDAVGDRGVNMPRWSGPARSVARLTRQPAAHFHDHRSRHQPSTPFTPTAASCILPLDGNRCRGEQSAGVSTEPRPFQCGRPLTGVDTRTYRKSFSRAIAVSYRSVTF